MRRILNNPVVSTSDAQQVTNAVPPLTGNRIINLHLLKNFTAEITKHASECGGEVKLSGEHNQRGLASILSATCTTCDMKISFQTSPVVQGSKKWQINLAAVWGQMATGGGYSTLQESMAVIGVPVMTKKSFIATERMVADKWWESLEISMKDAGAEEKQLAISRNSFHEGVPAITVIVDGGWSKRSHKHSYNAKSGVGIIVGKETGKILHLGVRNKYCWTCSRAESLGKEPSSHRCYRNWDRPSSSMETDIILEGFKAAESKHGLRYTKFIGDGDSSVHPTLVNEVPVWGHIIKKVECANHSTKCYRSSLEKLVQDNPQYKGKGKLTEGMRKRLTKAARCAIKMRSLETDRRKAVHLLQRDLENSPLHCFGIHRNCSPDYCKTAQQSLSSSLPPTHPTRDPEADEIDNNYEADELATIADQQYQEWRDATDDTDYQVPASSTEKIDEKMICDIKELTNRLVAKADNLLGK